MDVEAGTGATVLKEKPKVITYTPHENTTKSFGVFVGDPREDGPQTELRQKPRYPVNRGQTLEDSFRVCKREVLPCFWGVCLLPPKL